MTSNSGTGSRKSTRAQPKGKARQGRAAFARPVAGNARSSSGGQAAEGALAASESRIRDSAKAEYTSTGERLGLPGKDINELREKIAEGFSIDILHKLADELDLSVDQILPVVHLSRRTYTRRQQTGRLNAEESDRVATAAVVFSEAEELFEGDREAARRWMVTSAPALGGDKPIDVISTETGARQVSGLIHKLEHGIFP